MDRNPMREGSAAALSIHAKRLSTGGKVQLKQSGILQGLKDMQKFLDERAAELPGLGETGMRKKLDDITADLTSLAATQTSSGLASMSLTMKINALTKDLIDHHMSHVARIAAVELPPGPELVPLGMPKKYVAGERLVARARGMATQAVKFESTFITAGLPKDFIKQLRDAADTLSALFSDRKQNVADRGAATKLLVTNIQEVRKVVKVLDGFVKTTAKDNPRLLVTWKILKRLRQTGNVPPSILPDGSQPIAATTPTSTGAAA
jgi:hypothetical protein